MYFQGMGIIASILWTVLLVLAAAGICSFISDLYKNSKGGDREQY